MSLVAGRREVGEKVVQHGGCVERRCDEVARRRMGGGMRGKHVMRTHNEDGWIDIQPLKNDLFLIMCCM